MKEKVAVGVSGGVDSSLAAYLLQKQGYDVLGIYMDLTGEDGLFSGCNTPEDKRSAEALCEFLGIPFYSVDLSVPFREYVVKNFISQYARGLTPNPDILCNANIKFGSLLREAEKLGAKYFATGHYMKKTPAPGGFVLEMGADARKDQSYFLSMVAKENFERVIFPLGDMKKGEVRDLAEQIGLPAAGRAESMDICFIGSEGFREYMAGVLGETPGDIIDIDTNEKIGSHRGAALYTIGQRRGLGVGGGRKWFVCGKDMDKNIIYAACGENNPALYKSGFIGSEFNLFAPLPEGGITCEVKYRYARPAVPCKIRREGEALAVTFEQPQRGVAPGQTGALYSGRVCLGGCVIGNVF
ncbi:MAG: tRNA 2-thiouridine(34) synthase MnmA [Eubacteriaceae bacterium]|nr:tRNA 2-thiouridine(34) synthase MnmA [Eubacteriaceae bacterium]